MSNSEWNKVRFQDFLNKFNKELVLQNAPTILYSKKDKEHEVYNAIIAFFFISGFLLIYISLSIIFIEFYFSLILFVAIIIISTIAATISLIIYIRSNTPIKPIETWVEIYESRRQEGSKYYCFSYYPVFSGKCLPNKAKNVVYKLYQEYLLKSRIDVTQIELYLKENMTDNKKLELIGFFFQYGEGTQFRSEDINRNSWKFFPYQISLNENFFAIANWDHQYEWRNDLELDYDKLHEYAPWVIKTWNKDNLKPLTEIYKKKLKWELRQIDSIPKLKPWSDNFEMYQYESYKAYKDIQIMNEAISKVIGNETKIEKLKDLKGHLMELKAFFRDLNY